MKKFIKKNLILVLAILYLLSPIDIIPDFIPGLGVGDDVLVAVIALINKFLEYQKEKKAGEKLKNTQNSNIKEGELVE